MNNAASISSNFWEFREPTPQPNQDSDLLAKFNFVPGLKEILLLRQVHALEHATVWVLSETAQSNFSSAGSKSSTAIDDESLGGLSTEAGFYLYGQVNPAHLRRAVMTALNRLRAGEWDLALHPRCGTNLSVAIALTAAIFGTNVLLSPREPLEQLIGLGVATTTVSQLAPDLGTLAQKYLTTSIPFNLAVEDIYETYDFWGHPAYFVQVRWH
ncbi:DUF6391 domain-containing protein [Oscillatoria salina]|uniref:DUF6391 domain-containing protein n=1 Tax=Oscillatoria salina TaxID=331517 RepID=UPI001CCD15A7|nr:DUF6391 domain-containing protein [Oscillatoria salina]MBZ8181153.1 hypothetical protein [Oscillatoria salina IIICB1]